MKLKEIKINNFRGVADQVTVPLVGKGGGPPVSVLIFGDNGAGKSSIVDAIEFIIRGQVSRHGVGGKKQRREIRNLFSEHAPGVVGVLSDQSVIGRGWVSNSQGVTHYGQRREIPGMASWPVAVRRQDVEEFWRIDEDRRQEFFFDYFLPPGASFVDEQKRLEVINRYDEALEEHAAAVEALRPFIGAWDGEIPQKVAALPAFRRFITRKNRSGPRRSGLPSSIDDALTRFESALTERNHLSGVGETARAARTVDLGEVTLVFTEVSKSVARDFSAITNIAWLEGVNFEIGESGLMRISLKTTGGASLAPTDVLSEAHLDLLALMILIELHVTLATDSERRIIVLDDVFQSVDGPMRQRALAHIVETLEDWQIVLTLHDGLWLKSAQKAFESAKRTVRILKIKKMPRGGSPLVMDIGAGPLSDLRDSISHNASPISICQSAGRAFEGLCHEISFAWTVMVNRPRRDEYQMADLWIPIKDVLVRCGDPAVVSIATALDQERFLRNEASHPNETADSMSEAEAQEYAQKVIDLWGYLTCNHCGRFVKSPTGGTWMPECVRSHF